ncbi:MAG: LCP family protein [Treponema sp.]|jgi:anionic cell wall polymer biosynthesis LytR-Cps2A-Psr (LCP) family protein|nr:LCP family protein [Treponema sp.]
MAKKIAIHPSILFLLIILGILLITGGFIFTFLQTDTVAEAMKEDPILKVLFVLEDNNSALTTDVLFYYPPLKRGALFDVPGNTGAIFTSLNRVDRIDAVYWEKGIEAYRREIEHLFGQTIPFTMVISLDSLCKMTDLLGGLKVFIPYPVDMTDAYGVRYLLPSGSVTLDGEKIRTYMTYVPAEENLNETQDRSQNMVVALLNAFNAQAKYFRNKRTFKPFYNLISANSDHKDAQHLFMEIAGIDAEQLHPQSISGTVQQVDTQHLLFPLYDGQLIKDVVKQTVTSLVSSMDTQYSRIYVLEIQNGTTVQGLARNTAALLQSVGYDVFSTVNADSNDYEKTMIINHIGNEEVARNLGEFIRCGNIVNEDVSPAISDTDIQPGALVDFTIILGRDFDGRYVR